MPASSQLSPRGAAIVGLVCLAAGVIPILGGLGVISIRPTEGTPGWVAVAAGAMFVLAGAAVIVGYAVGHAGPDGDLPPGTPFWILLTQYLLGFGIVGALTAVTGWIAFGPGKRQFSTTLELPFLPMRWASGEFGGRAIFGVAAVLMSVFLVALTVVGIRRLRHARNDR